MKNIIKTIAIVAITAIITAAVTGSYMIQTAQPDRPCQIEWAGQIFDYE